MLETRFIHRCIPYCRPDHREHTQLVYTDENETCETLRRTLRDRWGIIVMRAAEEPDAPPQVDTSGKKPFTKAWLVTWQCEQDGEGV